MCVESVRCRPPALQQLLLCEQIQHPAEESSLGPAIEEALLTLREYAEVEPSVVEFESESVLPVDPRRGPRIRQQRLSRKYPV